MIEKILIICFTGLSTITLFLFLKQIVNELKIKNNLLQKKYKIDSLNKIITSHQNIFLQILESYDLNNEKNFATEHQILGTLLINHFFMIYNLSKNGMIEHNIFLGLRKDIKDAFSIKFIELRWFEIKNYYSKDFIGFIDTLLNY